MIGHISIVLAIICSLIVGIHFYLWKHRCIKRWPRLLLASNWLILAFVYTYDAIAEPPAAEALMMVSLAFVLLVIGEVAYHGDTITEIAGTTVKNVKGFYSGDK